MESEEGPKNISSHYWENVATLPSNTNLDSMKLNGSVIKLLKRELRLSNFSLKCDNPQCFAQCVWQKPEDKVSIFYLLYRWCFAIYFTITIVTSIAEPWRNNTKSTIGAKWPIYLTNWNYIICTIQAIMASWLVTERLILQQRGESKPQLVEMCYKYKIYWVLNTMGLVNALTLTTYYWVAICKPGSEYLDSNNLMLHVFNSVFMLLDLCITAHPIRLQHFYTSLSIDFVFCLFSVIYHFAGGTNHRGEPYLYRILNWRDPGKAVAACVGGMFAVIMFHILAWLLYMGRVGIVEKVKQKKSLKMNVMNNISV